MVGFMETKLTNKAKNWISGGKGAASGKPLVRALEAQPYVRRPLTEGRQTTFLGHYSETGDVAKAAQLTDGNSQTRRTYLAAMIRDQAFGKACEDALAIYASRVGEVLREEFFEGVLTPVVGRNGIVKDKSGKEVWLRKRDPKIVLALAKKHDFGLREIKTTINVDANNPTAENPDDPRVYVASSDLLRLKPGEVTTLTALLRKVHENRAEAMKDITPARSEYLEDDPLLIESTPVDPHNPFGI
jgi:hypothetical protein